MWISKVTAQRPATQNAAVEPGTVTIGGEAPGVLTDGERRALPVAGPGGYRWTPKAGAQVLVIKTGEGERMVVGALDDAEPEEIRLRAGGAELCLKNGGVTLTGNLSVAGSLTVSGTLTVAGRVI